MKSLLAPAALLATTAAAYLLWPTTDTDGIHAPPTVVAGMSIEHGDTNNVHRSGAETGSDEPRSYPAIPSEEPSRPDIETVFGTSVLKERNCDVREHFLPVGDGTVKRALSCEPRASALGPFDHYPDETLMVLAEADWEAARELGRRLLTREPRVATRYLLRAIALNPDPSQQATQLSPIWEIVHERFKTDAVTHGDKTAMKNMHLFYSLGLKLDPDYEFYAGQSRRLLTDAGISGAEIDAIEDRATLFFENMNSLRQEVLGEPALAEARL